MCHLAIALNTASQRGRTAVTIGINTADDYNDLAMAAAHYNKEGGKSSYPARARPGGLTTFPANGTAVWLSDMRFPKK
jgi:hypothetical protein